MFFFVPWLIAGDFNSVLTAAGTSNPRKLDQRRNAGFLEWIFDNILLDLGFSGSQLTWPRGTSIANFQGARLIRVAIGVPESTKFINLNSSYCRSIATTL